MGAHFAHRLAEAGAQVAAGDVKEDGLNGLAEECQGSPGQGPRQEARRVERGRRRRVRRLGHGAMGGLNGLINNAGILRDGLLVKKDRTTGAITKLSKENSGTR
jgi:3-oxoacyl-[acyl-carrier protein] reductase